jgi:demethylmenaquinone methyltransferase/2-methoxy-6-polyprenyl-1,4-benzoquinol methylase
MTDKPDSPETTHFGFQQVPVNEKVRKVGQVFDSVAKKYDIMNDLMSLGVHRLWKRFAIEIVGARPGQKVLDLASGTGDLAAKLVKAVGGDGRVIASDINASMLGEGRERLLDAGIAGNLDYVLASAESLPFESNYFDAVTISFGLRNVTHKDKALKEMYRVLKPGGRLVVLEFSKPVAPGLAPIYDAYSFKLLPLMGKLVANDAQSYRYLAESIRMHPGQEELKQMMRDAGFDQVDVFNLTGGIVAAHRGFKW